MIKPHQKHPLWLSFWLHRLSGLILALFLPVHFYILGLALNADAEQFDGFLRWSEQPLVKFAEMGLVFLLAIHLFGGLRLLALELLPWTEKQKTFAAAATATSLFFAFAFLVSVP